MAKIDIFRKKYPRFVYKKYFWKISNGNLNINFDFKVEPSIYFQPKIIIKNVSKKQVKRVGDRALNNLIFNLGLIELLSYWKTTCSPEIKIEAGLLNTEQIKWWKNLITKGMGQFFYENKIDFRNPDFIKIIKIPNSHDRANYVLAKRVLKVNRILVPIGGGKDSVVTLELLKKAGKNINCFSLNPTKAAQKIMKIGKCSNSIIVERKIDPKLLELNRKGFLNGHTPFSAYLAFLSVLLAILFDYKFIAFSNEKSSNEGNLKYLGEIINHQYSKSFDFEEKFRDYSKKYLAKDVEYFSFLRPLYEIQIARLFSQYPKYFNAFLSCNVAYQTNSGTKKPIKKWCGKCPKCLFIFSTLFPFVDEKELFKIFKKNLFEDKNLLPIMQQLIGEKGFKPFECVGTKKESLIAFYLALRSFMRRRVKLPILLDYFEGKILPKYPNLEKEAKKIMSAWTDNNNLPKEFKKMLIEAIIS